MDSVFADLVLSGYRTLSLEPNLALVFVTWTFLLIYRGDKQQDYEYRAVCVCVCVCVRARARARACAFQGLGFKSDIV